jgi:hypothetical protein
VRCDGPIAVARSARLIDRISVLGARRNGAACTSRTSLAISNEGVRRLTDIRDRLQAALDGYSIQRELAGGGMSRVFVARDDTLGRDVVIKVIAQEAEGLSADRFAREATICTRRDGRAPIRREREAAVRTGMRSGLGF